MKITVEQLTPNRIVEDLAGVTIGKKLKDKPKSWHRKMMLAEHSPIRGVQLMVTMEGIPKSVSTHLVRHGHCQHMVKSSRPDWTGTPRDEKAPVDHVIICNPQTIINISRKRLCARAEASTQAVWQEVVNNCGEVLAGVCVPECVYRGFCPEPNSCGYANSEHYAHELVRYRKGE